MADEHDGRPARCILRVEEVSAQHWIDAQEPEEVRGHEADVDELGVRVPAQDPLSSREEGELLEEPAALAVVPIVEGMEGGQVLTVFTKLMPEDDHTVAPAVRKRAQQDTVNEAEHHGTRGDAEPEVEDRQAEEPGTSREYAGGHAKIAKQGPSRC
jgi:hypothetical protein